MKKIGSFVLMAVMLLVGANVSQATTHQVASVDDFTTAWTNAESGDVIQLTAKFTLTKTVWLGTEAINGTPRTLTIDLNGKNLTSSATYAFLLTHGKLTIKNSHSELGGGLIGTSTCTNVFYVAGSTNKDVDPSVDGANYFTHLVIEKEVTITHEKYDAAISIDEFPYNGWVQKAQSSYIPAKPALGYITNVYSKSATSAGRGVAHGVRLDLYGTINGQKYGIKTNGNLGNPDWYFAPEHGLQKAGNAIYFAPNAYVPSGYAVDAQDTKYSPFVYVHTGASISVLDEQPNKPSDPTKVKNPIGIYASGYARWKVEGHVDGGVGALIKSGEVVINNAEIVGTGQTYSAAQATNSGSPASGSAIVIESTDAYAGGADVTVSGDSKVTATNGYAVEEVITTSSEDTKVETISITGGKFSGGQVPVDPEDPSAGTTQGTIKITDATVISDETTVTVTGGEVKGTGEDNVNIGGMTLEEYLSDQGAGVNTTVDIIDNGDGTTTMVVSVVEGSTEPDELEDINSAGDDAVVVWKHSGSIKTPMAQTLDDDLTLEKLTINQGYAQTLTIPEGKTLTVGRVILGSKAQIVVEAGGQFIVNGTQGITTVNTDNIVLKAEATERAVFLVNPAVERNRHPLATVEFISNSFTDGGNYAKQRFGIPTNGTLTSMTTKYEGSNVQTALSKYVYASDEWVDFGWINVGGKSANLDQMNNPFEYYQMQHNTPNMGTVVTMKGELVGSDSPVLSVYGNSWNGYANSYMAPINGKKLLSMIPSTVDKVFYLYDLTSEQSTWEPVTNFNPLNEILPMQPFLLLNRKSAANVTVNYGEAVYYPTTGETPAPARSNELDNITKAKLIVKGENSIDRLLVAEGEQFTKEFDNGFDAVKYMNDAINLYVTSDEKMGVFATDEIENTYVGFQTVNGGAYAIEFTDVQGENLLLIDLETGTKVMMTEGNMYTFTADANSANDYRFKIVRVKEVATDIDAIEAQKSGNGIYTIMGQYVGEMNLWNSLPAGVYVVDGAKRVK